MRRTRAILFTFVISGMLLTACGGKESAAEHQHGAKSERYETTASLTTMPEFLANYTDNTQATYATVNELMDVIKEIKCYCGCMDEETGYHDSLRRCFIAENKDGEVKWTDHGAQCGICLTELQDAKRLHDEGKSVDEIKEFIDNKYKGTES
ncbi:PCYCGC motif-containing (lipo)protein [Paenibacillus solani]|uniref:PCYCGC motif-containing (lipo)protein n=1 Tax=Paenibacillus solani TaxID=1705565 RepID=UPI003D2E34C6